MIRPNPVNRLQQLKDAGIVYVDNFQIRGFFDEFRFLSNFHVTPVHFNGNDYMSSEHAYMAAKARNKKDHDYVQSAKSCSQAKKRGSEIELVDDWELMKVEIMYLINLNKYSNPTMAALLATTGNRYLEETNWWGDKIWGVCEGIGQSLLGRVIMQVRTELGISDIVLRRDPTWRLDEAVALSKEP